MTVIAFISTTLLMFIVGCILGAYIGRKSTLDEYDIKEERENHKKVKNMTEEELRANIL